MRSSLLIGKGSTPHALPRRGEATARQEAPIYDNYSDSDDDAEPFLDNHLDLRITSTPQGRVVYWKGVEPSELLNNDDRLVAYVSNLPFQPGRFLPTIAEHEDTVLVEDASSSGEYSPECHVFMASTDEIQVRSEYDNELLQDVSVDEASANAPPNEDVEQKRLRQARNARRALGHHLTWLESLKEGTINSWADLKRAFVNNFQGSMLHASTRHDLA